MLIPLQTGVQVPPVTDSMLVVLGIVLLALVLFVTELLSVDVTALLVLVLLAILEPWTRVTPTDALSGFSNEATVTVLAMLILSESIRRTGAVQQLGHRLAPLVGDSERRQVAATVGIAGAVSGFVSDTPVVALLVPFASDLADRGNTSPSKLLIPLSYAAMLGGTLTLIGTSTNLLASGLASQLLGRKLSIFQFTPVGVVVLVVGALYLVFVAPRLLPERVRPRTTMVEAVVEGHFLTEFVVAPDSPLVGTPIVDVPAVTDFQGTFLEVLREGESLDASVTDPVQAGDVLVMDGDRTSLAQLLEQEGLDPFSRVQRETDAEGRETERLLLKAFVPPESALVGSEIGAHETLQQYDARLVALRRGDFPLRRLRETEFAVGDMLLLQVPTEALERAATTRDFTFVRDVPREDYRYEKIPVALGILAGVVGLAALGVLEIQIAALLGVVGMVISGTITPTELYDNIEWRVFFLLAGIIPLGVAMENTGTAAFLGALVATTAQYVSPLVVLGLFYVTTVVLTNVISNNATVALMVPVAINAARQLDVDPLAFLLAVMFAASAAFVSPVGYQTNLFVYGPGGYRFTDYLRVGGPLQAVFAVVTTVGIALIWGV